MFLLACSYDDQETPALVQANWNKEKTIQFLSEPQSHLEMVQITNIVR